MPDLMHYRRIVRDCACAACGQGLILLDRPLRVECSNPDCKGGGYISRDLLAQQQAQARADYLEAQRNLAEALGLAEPAPKSIQLIMSELGY